MRKHWIYCGDCHPGNLFFFEEAGQLRAGILDHDLLAKASEIPTLPPYWLNHASNQVVGLDGIRSPTGFRLLNQAMEGRTPVTAQELNAAMYDFKVLNLRK